MLRASPPLRCKVGVGPGADPGGVGAIAPTQFSPTRLSARLSPLMSPLTKLNTTQVPQKAPSQIYFWLRPGRWVFFGEQLLADLEEKKASIQAYLIKL
jgi:hypothetical protein